MGLHAVTHRKLPRLCSARRFPRRWPHHNSNVTGQIYPSTIWIYLIFDTSATWYNLMQSDSVSSWFFFFVALDAGTGAWESFQSVSLADHGRPVLCPRQYRRVALSHHPDKGGSKQAFVRLQGAKASWWCKIAKHWLIIIYIYRYYQPTNARNTKKRSGIKKQTSCWAVCYHAPNWGLHARSKCCGTLGGRGP